MKVISQNYKPRRTGLIARIVDAKSKGLKRLALKTAVDVYGAINLQTQVKNRCGIAVSVRRYGSGVCLMIDPPKAKGKRKSDHTRLRKVLQGLAKGECLLLTTPLEVFSFNNLRNTMREAGTDVMCMRNCTNLMVWKKTAP